MKTKRVIAMLISLSLMASMAACGTDKAETAAEEKTEEIVTEAKLTGLMDQAMGSHSSASGKDEVVYVIMDADGEQENVIVSDQLKNADGSRAVNDVTELKDISNVNGYGGYEKNDDGTITWEADGSDIFYRGTTDKVLPVSVKVSYELDGQKISAKDLAGKDGHVKIRLDYENRSKESVDVDGNEYEVNVPFVMVSGMILPNDTFSNVSVTNGKVIGEGNNEIVLGLAYPGLKESLDWDNTIAKAKDDEAREKLEEINIPDYVEIEADAHDFELGMTMTLAGCDIFDQVDASDSIDLGEIQDKMDELGDGSKQLVNGTCDLKDGTQELLNGTMDLKNGTAELKNGTGDLANGTVELKNGTAELKEGTGKLYQGAQDLKDGTGKLKNGAGDLANGSNDLYEGSKTLKKGTEDLYNGTKTLKEGTASLQAGSGSLYEGIVSYTGGATQISAGAKQVADGAASAKNGADALKAGIDGNNLVGGASSLADGAAQISEGIDTLTSTIAGNTNASVSKMNAAAALTSAYAEWMQGNLQSLAQGGGIVESEELQTQSEALTGAVSLTYEQCLGALQLAAGGNSEECIKAITACKTAAALYASIGAELQNAMASVPEQVAPLKNGADQLAGGASALAGGLKSISEGVDQLDSGLDQLSQGAASLSSGADNLVKNNDALVKGAADLKAGAGKLDEGAGSLVSGAGKVYEGAGSLSQGAGKIYEGSKSLYNGADQLDAGAGSLTDGVAKIDAGAGKLNDGAGRLNDGAAKLNEGAGRLDEGALKLSDGAARLDDGAAKLRDGMIKLDEEGIQKVTELLGDDAADVLNRFKAVRMAGANYNSFTGALDDEGSSNSVRFIYKTGAVK